MKMSDQLKRNKEEEERRRQYVCRSTQREVDFSTATCSATVVVSDLHCCNPLRNLNRPGRARSYVRANTFQ